MKSDENVASNASNDYSIYNITIPANNFYAKYSVAIATFALATVFTVILLTYIWLVSRDKELTKIFFFKLSIFMCLNDVAQEIVLIILVWLVTVEEDILVRNCPNIIFIGSYCSFIKHF